MDVTDPREQLEQLHELSHGWALACCGQDAAEAGDVLQTAYLKILSGRATFKGQASFKTWLFAVIRHTAADERRRQWLRRLRLGDYFRERGGEMAEDTAAENAIPADRLQEFQQALARLPRRQREVLHLVFYQDLTIAEAARVMGVGLGSARQHYERGKKRLRAWWETANLAHEYERNRAPVAKTLP